jgi:hypothetical protein
MCNLSLCCRRPAPYAAVDLSLTPLQTLVIVCVDGAVERCDSKGLCVRLCD